MDKAIYEKMPTVRWLIDSGCTEDVSPLGAAVAELLSVVYGGIDKIDPSRLRKTEWGNSYWISVVVGGSMSTVDGDLLTRLVVLSSDMALRLTVSAVSNGHIELMFHSRKRSIGLAEMCPPLESQVSSIRDGADKYHYDSMDALRWLRKDNIESHV